MEGLRLEDVERALATRDASLVDMVVSLANQSDPSYSDAPEGAYTIHDFRAEVRQWGFRWKDEDEKRHIRVEGWARLESDDADVELSDRYELYTIVEALHEADGAYARETLLEIIRRAPIRWGVWRGLKRLFKETEKSGDLELYGALLARIDSELSNTWGGYGEVSARTLTYLARRGWRFLRKRGANFPAAYVDSAVAALREYPESTNWTRTWVANHIFFHDYEIYGGKAYGQNGFSLWQMPDSMTEYRAYSDLWRVDPRPLFGLLERARSEQARRFAIEGLKEDFRAELRELEVENILRLIQVPSATVHEFAVWLLENAPRFEQAAFRDLGLHDAVLSLLDSPGGAARAYACDYVRTHSRDLPVEDLLRLANHHDSTVRELSYELIRERDPRKDVGIDGWGRLLGTSHAHDLAVEMIKNHFGASELTLDWFRERFTDTNWQVYRFAIEAFPGVHEIESVDAAYYVDLIEAESSSGETATFALESLGRLELKSFDLEIFRRLLVHPQSMYQVETWLREDRFEASSLGVDYWRALAFEPSWGRSDWVRDIIAEDKAWTRGLTFQDYTANVARRVLTDERVFAASKVGLDWWLEVIGHSDEEAREWASEYVFRAFAPADFDPSGEALAGSERVFEMGIGEGAADDPLASFARQYLRRHHDLIGKRITDETVPEERRLPESFLTFERFRPLLVDSRIAIRRFALEIARCEMARWSPSLGEIIELCETRRGDIQQLFTDALLADDTKENQRLRISPDAMELDGVYAFCESLDRGTRSIGMKLIERYPQFRAPARLFALSDSPDRRIRGFVIKMIWALYRDRAVTETWQPGELDAKYTSREDVRFERGPGLPETPDELPAEAEELRTFLRRVLFGLPPARPPRGEERGENDPPPIPARRAKLYLLEVMRDVALEDREFAILVTPLLNEFVHTLGKSERGACLVALARIEERWENDDE